MVAEDDPAERAGCEKADSAAEVSTDFFHRGDVTLDFEDIHFDFRVQIDAGFGRCAGRETAAGGSPARLSTSNRHGHVVLMRGQDVLGYPSPRAVMRRSR
jgi:hypothetical protein